MIHSGRCQICKVPPCSMSSLSLSSRHDGMREVSNLQGLDIQNPNASMLHTGPVNAATQAAIQHPLERSEQFSQERKAIAQVKLANDVCGSSAAQQLKMDIAHLNDPMLYRLPLPDLGPVPTQGLDVVLGNDETMHLKDQFNRVEIVKDVSLMPSAKQSSPHIQLDNILS